MRSSGSDAVVDAPTLVTMRDGTVTSVDALRLLWRLEDAGLIIKIVDGRLFVGPRGRLPEDVRRAIAEHRDELIGLVTMCASGNEVPA